MAVKPVADIDLCHHCNTPVFDADLLVTKCGHVFDQACLEKWYKTKKTCPLDQAAIQLEDCKSLKQSLESFSVYDAEDEAFVISILPESQKDEAEYICAICHKEFSAAYFIRENKRFIHQACWIKLHPTTAPAHPRLYPEEIATVERKWSESGRKPMQLPPRIAIPSKALAPAGSPRGPAAPISPLIVVLGAITPFVSLWAYLMNTRVYYRNPNVFLFVLSIPILLTLKIFAFISFLFKRVLVERNA